MKIRMTGIRCVLLFTLAALVAGAEPLTQGDRDRAMSHLHSTRKLFLDAVAGLTPAQWAFKPNPGTWSVAECAEHITLSEEMIFGLVQKIMASPAQPDKKSANSDQALIAILTDRSNKAQAPEFLRPSNRWPTPAAMVEHFKGSRSKLVEYVQNTQDDLRKHFGPHPLLKELDAYQWILLISAHSERHTAQINEVKAHAGFPK